MLTLFLPLSAQTQDDYYIEDSDALEVGAVLDADRVVAIYPYSPVNLCVDQRVQLAIIHPVGQTVPPPSAWACWENRLYSPHQSWHIVLGGNEVLRVREKPAGQLPALGSPLVDHYYYPNEREPDLTKTGVLKLAGEIKAKLTGLTLASSTKHINHEAPYNEIYVIQAVPSRFLQSAS